MLTGEHIPVVSRKTDIREAIEVMNAKRIGATLVVDGDRHVIGIMTDGDLRRALLKYSSIYDQKLEDLMSPSPRTIGEKQTAAEALEIMEMNGITHLVVNDTEGCLKGIAHLHDLLGREDFRINGNSHPTNGFRP